MFKLNCGADLEFIDSVKLEDMQRAVGGSIEMVDMRNKMVVYANENGILEGLNPSAYIPSFLDHLGFGIPILVRGMIFGNVVIAGVDRKLTKKQQEHISNEWKRWRETLSI